MSEADDALAVAQESAETISPDSAATFSIEIAADPTVSYASYQNAITVVQSIHLHNATDANYQQLEVTVTAAPDFAEPIQYHFESIDAHEKRLICPVVFRFNHRYLSTLTEAERGHIRVVVKSNGEVITSAEVPTTILAFDQWGGTRVVPELLAAFSTPNNPHVDRLLAEAAERLLTSGEVNLDGYKSKNRTNVWSQVSAIYSAIASRGIQYSVPPAGFASSGQKIRLADRILTGGVATCLDFALLLTSCLEQAGLNPLIFLNDGHAWIGCWLVNTSFAHSVTDDPLAVRKRVDTGEMMVFETTGLSQRPALSLKLAQEKGYSLLKEEAAIFTCAIDIRRARLERIMPLPSKDAAALDERAIADKGMALELPPVLPPLVGESIRLDEDVVVETADGRLGRWKSKLLDMTLRNKLLNFKATRTMLPLLVPDPHVLEDALSDGREWKFRPAAAIMTGADPRSLAHAQATSGRDPRIQQAQDAMAVHELLSPKDSATLDKTLNEIFLTARNSLEEIGANTLYLALGFLRWAEDEQAEKTYLAPLIMVPVTLKRAGVRTGYSIVRHDDETLVNPTLLQALRDKYGVNLVGLEPPPQDDKGVDVQKIFAIFHEAIKEIPRWEIVLDVYLGVFSFSKYVMYADLKNRAEELRRNRVVAHLIDRSGETIGTDDLRKRHDLDEEYGPGALMSPMSADSSQLNAVRRADQGKDFVLFGPPGTGKSQTITNIISHFLAKSKTVLFVSEKMAALAVVERRLKQIGLGPYCLQLHSSKAVKAEVLAQLNATLQHASSKPPAEWDTEVMRITLLRNELNSLVAALHKSYDNGLSVRKAIDTAVLHRGWIPATVSFADGTALSAAQINQMHSIGTDLSAVGRQLATDHPGVSLGLHPLAEVALTEWSHRGEDEFAAAARELNLHATELVGLAKKALDGLGLGSKTVQPMVLNNLNGMIEVLLQCHTIPRGFAEEPDPRAAQAALLQAVQAGEERNAAMLSIANQFKPEIASIDAASLSGLWAAASAKWFLPRFFAQRALLSPLAPLTISGKRPTVETMAAALPAIKGINQADAALHQQSLRLKAMLADVYQADKTNWAQVGKVDAWSKQLEHQVSQLADLEVEGELECLTARVRDLSGKKRELIADRSTLASDFLAFQRASVSFDQALRRAREISHNADLGSKDAVGGYLVRVAKMAAGWSDDRQALREWCQWKLQLRKLWDLGLPDAAARIAQGVVPPADIVGYLDYSYQLWWLRGVMDRDIVLRSFSGAIHDQKILTFRQADERFQELTKALIAARLSERAAGLAGHDRPKAEMAILSREIQKQRRQLPIRKLVRGIPTLLTSLKPCLLMSPLSVANYLDPSHPPFDVVVFDEASQIPVWDAVGVIARGKQVIVVGDPKQLPPMAFFGAGDDDAEAPESPDDFTPPDDLESILSECLATGMSTINLEWHYRSKFESLIAFSNQHYYDSSLLTFPSPVTQDTAVKLIPVNGVYDRGQTQTNHAEAVAVVKRLIEHFSQEDLELRKQTIGVVTFNMKQMRKIDDLLAAELGKNPELETRMAAHGDERPFIKNLENVQGDERDHILFSTTFGKDSTGKLSMNFGPINNTGGERRLNVAVTRARRGVEIYSSLRPEDIDLSKTRAIGVAHLKAYIDFAIRGPVALAAQASPTGRSVDSPLEQEILDAIRAAGFEAHPQVGCAGYRIDIGVVDKGAPGSYLVGVECDGATYHSMATARDRDRLRQSVLEDLGWTLIRVWSTEWWMNQGRCKPALLNALMDAQALADRKRGTPAPDSTAAATRAAV